MGIFKYYEKCIPDFETKTTVLKKANRFPISGEAYEAFVTLREDLQHILLPSFDKKFSYSIQHRPRSMKAKVDGKLKLSQGPEGKQAPETQDLAATLPWGRLPAGG